MPIKVEQYLEERSAAACAGYDPISEFANANVSFNQSLLSRWPDVTLEQRSEEVRLWYGRLRQRIDEHMRNVFGDDNLPELRSLYIREALEGAIRHATSSNDPTQRTERQEYFEKAQRARAVQIMRVLIGIDDELAACSNVEEVAGTSQWLQCNWGQHGAHYPDGPIVIVIVVV